MKILNLKRRFLTILACLVTALVIAGCGKDNDNDIKNSGSLRARIGNNDRTFTDVSARWVDNSNYLEITGRINSNEWLSITVLSETTKVPIGKYTLDDNTPFSILAMYHLNENNAQQNFTASRQTIWPDAFALDINKLDNNVVEGKFSGKLVIGSGTTTVATIDVENGSFSAPIRN